MAFLGLLKGAGARGGEGPLASFGAARLAARAYGRLLDDLPAPEPWVRAVREAEARGPVVYVVRNASLLDLVALDHLIRRLGLARLGFASEVHGPRGGLSRGASGSAEARLARALAAGASALVFLKRAPTVLDRAAAKVARGLRDGEALLEAVVAAQRTLARPVQVIPQLFVWTHRPERLGFSLVDAALGPAEFPGELRSAGQLLFNRKNCAVRAGEVVDVRELALQQTAEDDATIARRLGYSVLRKLERERRAVVGPAEKPPDRVREEVLRGPKLQAVIKDLAGPGQARRVAMQEKARGMLVELQATPDATALMGLERAAETLFDRVYQGVDVDEEGLERVRDAARRGSVVYLPSHKSHIDYMLLSFVLRRGGLQVPVVAAGDNLMFFPVGPLFRAAGAFFIRRSFKGDRLYTAVVDAYVRRLIKDGHAIEFFLEGGRSRQGKLLAPQLGLLNMVVDAALSVDERPVSFVPVSIGYERTVEGKSYARELAGGSKQKEDASQLLRVGEVLRDKYGRASVQFGEVLDLDDALAELGAARRVREGAPPPKVAMTPGKRRTVVTRLAHRAMSEINRVTSVTPGSLVATALLGHRSGTPHAALVERCRRLTALVIGLGARTSPSLTRGGEGRELREASIREAALLYVRGGLVRQHVPGETLTGTAKRRARIYTGTDVIYTVPDEQRILLDIPKNTIIHLFVDRALVAVAMLASPGPPTTTAPPTRAVLAHAELETRVQSLSRLFKFEFMFRADAPFEEIFADTLEAMRAAGEVAIDDAGVTFGAGHDGLGGRGWIAFYASVVQNFIESYRAAARAVRLLGNGALAEKELSARALQVAERMFLGGEIERAEAVSRPVLENAFAAFVEQGYLKRAAGKLSLAASFEGDEAGAIEEKIASYLRPRESV
ncbi:MAG TPA: 1-acyl-sn-glycerol-3-phosphate acyltransferase [Byssovorax sp.]